MGLSSFLVAENGGESGRLSGLATIVLLVWCELLPQWGSERGENSLSCHSYAKMKVAGRWFAKEILGCFPSHRLENVGFSGARVSSALIECRG